MDRFQMVLQQKHGFPIAMFYRPISNIVFLYVYIIYQLSLGQLLIFHDLHQRTRPSGRAAGSAWEKPAVQGSKSARARKQFPQLWIFERCLELFFPNHVPKPTRNSMISEASSTLVRWFQQSLLRFTIASVVLRCS